MNEILKTDEKLQKLLSPQKAQAGIVYNPSQYALTIPHDGKSYVFHTLTKQCVEAELPLSCTAGEGFDDLIAGYFLVPREQDESTFYMSLLKLMNTVYKYNGPSYYTVLPTLACNARCVYCYEEGAAPLSMNMETAAQTARYIIETSDRRRPVAIRWFGGEPMLGVKFIDRISEDLLNAGVDYFSYTISNGSLITPAIVDKMAGLWKLRDIQISMDGAEEDYRRRKCYLEYCDVYCKVMEAVSLMSEAGIHVTVRCNVDEENWPRIPRYLEDMRRGISDKKNVSLYFAPLYDVRFGGEDIAMWKRIITMEPEILKAGFKLYRLKEIDMTFRRWFCISDCGASVVFPDGKLSPCEHYPIRNVFGDIWRGETDPETRKDFCRKDRIREKCRNCPYLPLCTPFATCPLEEADCRDVQGLFVEDAVIKAVEKQKESADYGCSGN